MVVQPRQRTSMKNELGLCTRRLSLCMVASSAASGLRRSEVPRYGMVVEGGGEVKRC